MKHASLIALGLFCVAQPAFGQAAACRIPGTLQLPGPIRQDEPTIRAAVAGYTLAVSWSPEFCQGPGGRNPRNAVQCGGQGGGQGRGQGGPFGFILHGLWPEARSGPAPQWCTPPAPISPQTYRDNVCMTPSPWLLQHEWAKHGTCMVADPARYYQTAAILWRSLRLPDPSRIRSAGELRAAFVAGNPAFTRGGVGLVTGKGGWLREMHLCYGADFMPATCRRDLLGPRDAAPLKVARQR